MSFCRTSASERSRGSSPVALHRSTWNVRVSLRGREFEHPLQRRVGDDAAVPVIFAVDFGGRKARGQRAARHDVAEIDSMGGGVEIGEIAVADIDRADAQARFAGIEPVEIDQPLQRLLERRDVVMAELRRARRGPDDRRGNARAEEAGRAQRRYAEGAELVERAVHRLIDMFDGRAIGRAERAERRLADRLPEFAQLLDPFFRRIARDQRRIDGPDRNAGNPVGMNIGFRERLINAALVGAERAAALQDQRHGFERRRGGVASGASR